MSSMMKKYNEKQMLLKQLNQEIQQLEESQEMTRELEFKRRLEDLMAEFEKKDGDVVEMLAPNDKSGAKQGQNRRRRKLKVYENPHTQEVIETRGGNHKKLKEWKTEYGSDTVESWLKQ